VEIAGRLAKSEKRSRRTQVRIVMARAMMVNVTPSVLRERV
jgi:hypothetical protein